MKRHKHMNMGSVISGTMRPEDLIPAFLAELENQTPTKREHQKLVREITRQIDSPDSEDEPSYYESDGALWDLESLLEALQDYCLPYFYFGAHQGDGADYGYWLSESWEDSIPDGALKVSDTSEIPRGYTGEVFLVNDHGNLTLFKVVRGRKYEVWGVV